MSNITSKTGAGGSEVKHTPLTYNSYLKIHELKRLQVCLSEPAHHDEPLFIVIHQAYELWFKLILHEIDAVFSAMAGNNPRRATFLMRRINTILKLLVQQIHILETMNPRDFLGFRYNLSPASGFQSSQFREIEFAAGLCHPSLLEHFKQDSQAYEELLKRYNAPSLRDAFFLLLQGHGFNLPETVPGAAESEETKARDERVAELLRLYDEQDRLPELHDLAETLVEFDELIFLWRVHHVTVVERMIGFKRGTGGSEGVGYLRSTLDKRCFPELWQVRTVLQQLPGG